jgi:hypothetical protein
MKKLILSIATIAFLSSNTQAQMRLGIQGGASIVQPSVTTTSTGAVTVKGVNFVQPGLIMDFQLANFFSFKPSLNYLRSGYTQTTPITATLDSVLTNKIDNLYIPLDLCVPIKASKGKMFLTAGPTIVVGIGGNSSEAANVSGTATTPINKKIVFGNATGELKQINWGANFGLGYSWRKGLELKANYNAGVTNINNTSTIDYKSSVISILLGYYFMGKMK